MLNKSVLRTIRLTTSPRFPSRILVSTRSFVKVGDTVPVNYLKDEKAPVIKEDHEYPDWLFTILNPLPNKIELLEKFEKEGIEAMSIPELQRLKRLLSLEEIKSANRARAAAK